MQAKTLPSLGFSNPRFSPLPVNRGVRSQSKPQPSAHQDPQAPPEFQRWGDGKQMAPGGHRIKGSQAHSGLSAPDPRLCKAEPGNCSSGGSWEWNSLTICPLALPRPPVPFIKCPEGQNTEFLALGQTFYPRSLDRKAPKGSHCSSPCLHCPASFPVLKENHPQCCEVTQ